MRRICAFDIGVVNMAACVIDFASWSGESSPCPLATCQGLLKSSSVVHWSVQDIREGSKQAVRALSTSQVIEMTLAYIKRHAQTLSECDAIVIEQQPAAKMRHASIAVYCSVRSAVGDKTPIVFQPAYRKLDWGEGLRNFLPCANASTKARRKVTATRLAGALLRACGESKARELATFGAHKKKDDLADCFLHALAFAVRSRGREAVALKP